jgi:hypothetical protein
MTEWTNPRYADTVAAYRQTAGEPRRPRHGFAGCLPSTRTYGASTIVMVDPATRATYTSPTGVQSS